MLIALPASACPLAETARVTSYLASQSAGQCGPCLNGLPALAEVLGLLAFGWVGHDGLDWTRQLLGLVSGRGACHLPDGTAGLAHSTLTTFASEVRRHVSHGPCDRVRRAPVVAVPAAPRGRRRPPGSVRERRHESRERPPRGPEPLRREPLRREPRSREPRSREPRSREPGPAAR